MKQLLRSIRTHILIGGILIAPVAVTLWVILMLVNLLSSSKFTRWLSTPISARLPGSELTLVQALVSLFVVLTLLFVTGLVFRNFLGRRAYGLLDKMMERTPLINKVYMFVRTVSESILSQKETMFREVVLIRYPHPDSYSVAFVSASVPESLRKKTDHPDEAHVFVFLPTTPNPTSGYMLVLPRKDVTPLDMTTAEAMRLIVSAGASAPDTPDPQTRVPSLLEKLEHMLKTRKDSAPPEPSAHLNFPEPDDPV